MWLLFSVFLMLGGNDLDGANILHANSPAVKSSVSLREQIRVGMTWEQLEKVIPRRFDSFSATSGLIIADYWKEKIRVCIVNGKIVSVEPFP